MDKRTTQAYESFAEVFDKERHPKQLKINESQTLDVTSRLTAVPSIGVGYMVSKISARDKNLKHAKFSNAFSPRDSDHQQYTLSSQTGGIFSPIRT